MEWLRIGLAVIVTCAMSFGPLQFFVSKMKRRETRDEHFSENEKRRAQSIVNESGTLLIYGIQFVAGLIATIPAFAVLFYVGAGNGLPKLENALFFTAMFVGGWTIFSWCIRITDALSDAKS